MTSSAFRAEPGAILVADASVVINLNASGHARRIIEASRARMLVPANASFELAVGARFGHDDGRQLDMLVADGIVERIELGPVALPLYESLIDGSRGDTLDDGEATTIAAAAEHGAVALLDEKKARRVCRALFATLILGSTAELLLDAVTLGRQVQSEAMVNALQRGRMRVPPEFVESAIALIGAEQASACPSLPRRAREPGK